MPRIKLDTSLFEPVTIEVEGGRTYTSVPLSPALTRAMSKIDDKKKDGTIDFLSAIVEQVALIFGAEISEIEQVDIRILTQVLSYATEAMQRGRAAKPATTPEELKLVAEINEHTTEAEKNGPTPGAETSL